jgi:hypothetical protein
MTGASTPLSSSPPFVVVRALTGRNYGGRIPTEAEYDRR